MKSNSESKVKFKGSVYAFEYCGNIHESSYGVISLHYSRDGAREALKEHKQKKLDEFNKLYGPKNKYGFKFGEHEAWCITKLNVLP